MAITDKMRRTVVNNASLFRLLRWVEGEREGERESEPALISIGREGFEIPEVEHERMVLEIQKNILEMTRNFNAKVKVKGRFLDHQDDCGVKHDRSFLYIVIAAQGLNVSKLRGKRFAQRCSANIVDTT